MANMQAGYNSLFSSFCATCRKIISYFWSDLMQFIVRALYHSCFHSSMMYWFIRGFESTFYGDELPERQSEGRGVAGRLWCWTRNREVEGSNPGSRNNPLSLSLPLSPSSFLCLSLSPPPHTHTPTPLPFLFCCYVCLSIFLIRTCFSHTHTQIHTRTQTHTRTRLAVSHSGLVWKQISPQELVRLITRISRRGKP